MKVNGLWLNFRKRKKWALLKGKQICECGFCEFRFRRRKQSGRDNFIAAARRTRDRMISGGGLLFAVAMALLLIGAWFPIGSCNAPVIWLIENIIFDAVAKESHKHETQVNEHHRAWDESHCVWRFDSIAKISH